MMFFTVKNSAETPDITDVYIYGDIVNEKFDWHSENDVDLTDFKSAVENTDAKTINLYINSGGGSVFAASAMVGMLKRAKSKGKKICSYIDGLAASAASWLALAADDVYVYKNSMMMVHKPLTITWGNAIDFEKTIAELNQIENGVMIPLYTDKAKISEDKIKEMVANETWLTSEEIAEAFDVVMLDEEKQAVATSSAFFGNYKNLPKEFMAFVPKTKTEKTNAKEPPQKADLSAFENKINSIMKGHKEK